VAQGYRAAGVLEDTGVEQEYRTSTGLHTSRTSTGVQGYRCITGLQENMSGTGVVEGCMSSTGSGVQYFSGTLVQESTDVQAYMCCTGI
jgi:hypothetical protein